MVHATALDGSRVTAPVFGGHYWKAERDGSIQVESGFAPCEFVSPILHGEAGIQALREFVRFARAIGAKVNASCGLHVTVGVPSVIGTAETPQVAAFVRKLVHFAKQNAWAIYAQTGTDRHLNHYAHQLADGVAGNLAKMCRAGSATQASILAEDCGRGMVNLRKAFAGANGAIEFRAFAGTLNEFKVLHHVATALGLMRRAAVARGAEPPFRYHPATRWSAALPRSPRRRSRAASHGGGLGSAEFRRQIGLALPAGFR